MRNIVKIKAFCNPLHFKYFSHLSFFSCIFNKRLERFLMMTVAMVLRRRRSLHWKPQTLVNPLMLHCGQVPFTPSSTYSPRPETQVLTTYLPTRVARELFPPTKAGFSPNLTGRNPQTRQIPHSAHTWRWAESWWGCLGIHMEGLDLHTCTAQLQPRLFRKGLGAVIFSILR